MFINFRNEKLFNRIWTIIILVPLFCLSLSAQVKRETRAVWLTTNHRLDWPPQTYSPEKQKQSLIEILDDIKGKNLNTVYFQVRMNGTVLFKSSFEPLSFYITGEVDGTPSYDPLQFAIEQAHKRGLEIHAWVNVNLVFAGTEQNILKDPNHISKKKPEWIVEDERDGQKSLWMDPGFPEARSYIADLITEMVENYDVDGVHLDYMRYPGKNFSDDNSYKVYGANQNRDDYRRDNINRLVEEIGRKTKSVKHYIKLGAAPIGVYKRLKGMSAWESYYDLYQDSYGWLKKGLVDYVTPQIYWSIEENPHFDILAKDWAANSGGRNVILGIAAYKENVKPEIDEMVRLSRSLNTSGVCFFRYQHIKNLDINSFSYKTFPAAMPWMDGVFPSAPKELFYNYEKGKNVYTLSWSLEHKNDESDSIKYFSIYSLPKKNSPLITEYLFDVVSVRRNALSLMIDKPKKVNYFFALKSVNKIWNESVEASNTITLEVQQMKTISDLGYELEKPVLIRGNDKETNIIVVGNQKDSIQIFGEKGNEQSLLKKETVIPGKNIFSLQNNLHEYEKIKLIFQNEKKEVELKL